MFLLAIAAAHAGEHLVRQGETWDSVARAWGTDVATLQRAAGTETLPAPGAWIRTPDRAGQADVPAILASSTGGITASDPSGAAIAVRPGSRLPVGATLCTGDGANATVRLASAEGGHDDLQVSSSSCVRIAASNASGTTRQSRIALQSGSVSVRPPDAPVPSDVIVETASGVAAGTGGFRVHLESDGRTRLESTATTVAILGGGVEQPVARGYGSRVSAGRPPEPPTKLLEPGTPTWPADGAALREPLFGWTEVPRALGYRLEISTQADFSDVVSADDAPGPTYAPEILLLPTEGPGLWWRVASFDRTGFLGEWSPPRALSLPR